MILAISIIAGAVRLRSKVAADFGRYLFELWLNISADFSRYNEKKGIAAYQRWGRKWDTPAKMGSRSLHPGIYARSLNELEIKKRQNVL